MFFFPKAIRNADKLANLHMSLMCPNWVLHYFIIFISEVVIQNDIIYEPDIYAFSLGKIFKSLHTLIVYSVVVVLRYSIVKIKTLHFFNQSFSAYKT